ncbi:MAG: hypothetical protein BGO49_22825 [Planctomycetales bacterium 71-10]|nr:MAG: hypothetical protein BGO49_22825 [Planctomycetales bacterium 71-10]
MLSLALVFAALSSTLDDGFKDVRDPKALIAVMEAMRAAVGDYRCEFEGTEEPAGTERGGRPSRSYGGTYIWTAAGNLRSDFFEQRAAEGRAVWETVILRGSQGEFTRIVRDNDETVPRSSVEKPNVLGVDMQTRCGLLDPLDRIKATMTLPSIEGQVDDASWGGRPVKLLVLTTARSPDAPRVVAERFWIDLDRSGRVVRSERYLGDKVAASWDFELQEFPAGDGRVWMPVAATESNHVGDVIREEGSSRPVGVELTDEPKRIHKLHVLASTMEINKRPPASTFTPQYKPGTPISDVTRGLKEIYGVRKIADKPSKAEAEAMLADQIAQAERQGQELIAAPTTSSWGWPWLPMAFAVASAVLAAILVIQRRA